MNKVIKFYRKNCYGIERQFIHPENRAEAEIISNLINLKTIDSRHRKLITDLTGGLVIFQEVIAP